MKITIALGLSDYQRLRLKLAAAMQKELICASCDISPLKSADLAVSHAEALLDELGIPDPELTGVDTAA